MKLKTRMWLAIPRILAISGGAITCVVLLWLWFAHFRPSDVAQSPVEVVDETSVSTEVHSAVKPQRTMTMMVLEWSQDMREFLERYFNSRLSNDTVNVAVYNRDGLVAEATSGYICAAIDSVWRVDGQLTDKQITLTSLSTVLRTGFQAAKRDSSHGSDIVVIGRFPAVPTQKELADWGADRPILATDDYSWLSSASTRVVFLAFYREDRLRDELTKAFAANGVQFTIVTGEDLNAQ